MGTEPTPSRESAPKESRPTLQATRWLYAIGAAALLVIMLLGFQHFYMHGKASGSRPITPPILTLVVTHGAGMTLWVLLLVTQSVLVLAGKVRWHRALGSAGAVLAAFSFFVGFKVAIESARHAPPEASVWDLPIRQFMAFPVVSICLFAAFVTAAILNRKRPDLHRPLMLNATLLVVGAAADRYEPLVALYRNNLLGVVFGPTAYAFLFGLIFLGLSAVWTRRFDRHFAWGCAVVCAEGVILMRFAPTPAWESAAKFLLGE